MEHLGAQFKDAREAQGLSLQAIADKTKISVTVLEAVERNDFSRLPGGIFGRSFIRAYAIELGLDADSAVAGFVEKLEESEREAAARGAVRPDITPDDRRFLERQRRALFWLRVGMVAVVVGLVVLVGLAWGMRERLHFTSSPVTTSAPAAR
jgi:cytoskeleton protein RodZ